MRSTKRKLVQKDTPEVKTTTGRKGHFDYIAAVERATEKAMTTRKTSEKKTLSHIMLNWVAPTMAVVGWLLLIIFYVIALLDDAGGENLPPAIHDIQVTPETIQTGQTVSAKAFATDPDGDDIYYIWNSILGRIQLDRFKDDQCTYVAPDLPGADVITIKVYDKDGSDTEFEIITVVEGGKE
jgi:hypothetical protein